MAEKKIRQQFCFYGRVQGVGFRYKLYHLAERYSVTGWVRNEYDGSVMAEMQGQLLALEMIVQALENDRYIEITDIRKKEQPLREDERRFGIVH